MDPAYELLVISAIILVIPAAVLLGHRRAGGAIVVSGAAALAVSIIFWILLGGIASITNTQSINPLVASMLVVAGLLLQLAAWTLSIHGAATSRRWGWIFLLVVAGYLSFAALLFALEQPVLCFPGSIQSSQLISTLVCVQPNSLVPLLFSLAHLLGPAIPLIYGLVVMASSTTATASSATAASSPIRGRRSLPPGLSISSLKSTDTEEAEADTEPNLHQEIR